MESEQKQDMMRCTGCGRERESLYNPKIEHRCKECGEAMQHVPLSPPAPDLAQEAAVEAEREQASRIIHAQEMRHGALQGGIDSLRQQLDEWKGKYEIARVAAVQETKRADEAERKLEECEAMVIAEQHANARLRKSLEGAREILQLITMPGRLIHLGAIDAWLAENATGGASAPEATASIPSNT